MAFPEGFEPSTYRLEGGCSVRLSYGNLSEKRPKKGLCLWSEITDSNRGQKLGRLLCYHYTNLAENFECMKLSKLVEAAGFEPTTPWSQTKCATGLRYASRRGNDNNSTALRGQAHPVGVLMG